MRPASAMLHIVQVGRFPGNGRRARQTVEHRSRVRVGGAVQFPGVQARFSGGFGDARALFVCCNGAV